MFAADPMTTTALRRRRARGMHPRREPVQQLTGEKRRALPETLEAAEVQAILDAASNPRAKLLILLQWRAGLRVSEAPALEPRDLSLHTDRPTLRVRVGKGGKARVVPVHPELQAALIAVSITRTWAPAASSPPAGRPPGAGSSRRRSGPRCTAGWPLAVASGPTHSGTATPATC